ncbi:MAG: trimethylamine methyltransferase family protein, partial [Clostridiales bacterium]|nr:trimethylamine methyltransferase family protein [Clostridiales bacterium]
MKSNFRSLNTRRELILSEEDAQKFFKLGLELISEFGFKIDGTDEFNRIMIDFGCEINGGKLTFPKKVLDYTVDRINAFRKEKIKEPDIISKKIDYFMSGQATYWNVPEDNSLRPATREDLAAYHRMLDAMDVGRTHPGIIPQDVNVKTADLHAFATIAKNSAKPWRVSPFSAETIPYFHRVLTTALGDADKASKMGQEICFHKLWISSPFSICRETIEGTMVSRKLLGHKVKITIMPVSGASSPITPAGAIVQEVAEVIGANIISLAMDDYICGYCSSTNTFDFTSNVHCQPGPDSNIRRMLGKDMGYYMFGIPAKCGIPPTTGAATVGVQSVMEKCVDMTTAVMMGDRFFGAGGVLSQSDTASPVQMVLDIELRDYLQHMINEIDISDEAIGMDAIRETVPKGADFLASKHTYEYFKQSVWFPQLMDRRTAGSFL